MFEWNGDPILLSIGSLNVRWYGLCFAVGFMLSYRQMRRICQIEGKSVEILDVLLWFIVIGTILGARLAHCFFYHPQHYLNYPEDILKIWKGGLASHGGTIGIMLAVLCFKIKYSNSNWQISWLFDRIAIATPIAACCIRIGNFFNSEIIGIPTTLPWGVKFLRVDDLVRHPTMLYESISYFFISLLMWHIYKTRREKMHPWSLFSLTLFFIFASRFFIEFTKVQQASFSTGIPLSMGQLLSIPFVGICAAVFFWSCRKNRPRNT